MNRERLEKASHEMQARFSPYELMHVGATLIAVGLVKAGHDSVMTERIQPIIQTDPITDFYYVAGFGPKAHDIEEASAVLEKKWEEGGGSTTITQIIPPLKETK